MLIATGIMAIGLVLIATIFPVGVKLTGMSAERSIAAVVADEAFAKIQLYGLRDFADWPPIDPSTTCTDFMFSTYFDLGTDAIPGTIDDVYVDSMWNEFLYPSASMPVDEDQKYHWSALCRRTDARDVQVTVFVTRKTFAGMNYYGYPYDGANYVPNQIENWPSLVPVNVEYDPTKTTSSPLKELEILPNDVDNLKWGANTVLGFFDEGYTIVNDRDGKIYRILEMKDELPQPVTDGIRETIVLYEDWQWDGYDSDPLIPPATAQVETIWVVPPGVGSTRYPCVGVSQKVIHFDDIR